MTDIPHLQYDFLTPKRIVFGWGRRSEVGGCAQSLGRRVFIISGSKTLESTGRIDELETLLTRAGVKSIRLCTLSREPEVTDVDLTTMSLLQHEPQSGDFVLAIGGGSAIDLAKAAAAMATNRHGETVRDFLEGVGSGLKIENDPLPLLAMPTTAGTGSEATKNAVISSYDPPFKKSLRSQRMIPRIVLIDPELHTTAPRTVTAHSGMDAITQLIESFISCRAKPIPQALCREGLIGVADALEEAVRDGQSRIAREKMAHAALLSGIALANSGLGMAHGVAAALGVHHRVPHGLACAVMLPIALHVNRSVRPRELAELAPLVTGRHFSNIDIAVDALLERIEQLAESIGIPTRLSELGVTEESLPDLVADSRGNSMNGNPRELSDDELLRILGDAL